jgi:hypothetical protein
VANPNKKTPLELDSLARAYTEVSIQTLGNYVNSPQVEPDIKIRAISILLDRGWGRPKQDNTHQIGGEVRVILRKMLDDESESDGDRDKHE